MCSHLCSHGDSDATDCFVMDRQRSAGIFNDVPVASQHAMATRVESLETIASIFLYDDVVVPSRSMITFSDRV